ncbi:MAG: hypothetical protein ACYTFA_03530 [Planctomycetota bacterium]|jgi:hypothetical protein
MLKDRPDDAQKRFVSDFYEELLEGIASGAEPALPEADPILIAKLFDEGLAHVDVISDIVESLARVREVLPGLPVSSENGSKFSKRMLELIREVGFVGAYHKYRNKSHLGNVYRQMLVDDRLIAAVQEAVFFTGRMVSPFWEQRLTESSGATGPYEADGGTDL